ncbi:MAG: flagellar hook-associated protein FlgL [Candidatus Eremiobacterota bacterium]
MRIPESIAARESMRNLNNLNVKLDNIRNSISTGQRLRKLSDDPGAMFRALEASSSLEKTDQYVKNINSLEAYSATVERSLGVMDETFIRVRSMATSNGIETDTKLRPDLAAELDKEIELFLSTANQKHEGKYIFSGSAVETKSFTATYKGTSITSVAYNGNSQHLKREIGEDLSIQSNVPGSDILGGVQADANPFEIMISLRDNILSGTMTGTGPINMPGSTVTGTTLLGAGSPPFIQAPAAGVVRINDVDIDWTGATDMQDLVDTINAGGAGVTAKFDEVRQKLLITPDDVTQPVEIEDISGNFTQFTFTGNAPARTPQFLDLIDKSFDKIVSLRAQTGIVVERALDAKEGLTETQNDLGNVIKDEAGTDLASAIVDMLAYEKTLQGALSVTARIYNLKLMDYLS